jgi:hypothetical protein
MVGQLINNHKTNHTMVIAMRQAGASLEQIADTIGRTKERVRQILVKNTGSTRHNYLSTQQLYQSVGLPRNRIIELYKEGVIAPKAEWTSGSHHYLLWPSDIAEKINNYYNIHRLCKICEQPLGKGRWVYCSDSCYREGQKYKYKSDEAKKKHLRNIKEYMERRKELSLVPTV